MPITHVALVASLQGPRLECIPDEVAIVLVVVALRSLVEHELRFVENARQNKEVRQAARLLPADSEAHLGRILLPLHFNPLQLPSQNDVVFQLVALLVEAGVTISWVDTV